MPVQPSGVWGIDLGQCGLKALRLQEIDGEVVATAFDYVEHPKILSQPDADPDQLTREALDKFLSRNSLRGDIVAISVPGQSGLARFVKLPPVEEKKIADIVRFEAKQQIPFNLDEVVWDYQKIGSGVVTDGFAMETEIGLFAMKRDMVSRYLQHFKDVGVEVHLVQMAPLALCNFVAYDLLGKDPGVPSDDSGQKNCVVALDIGADASNLVITDGERIIWQRPIPLGGNHFTRALTKDLKLTFAKAEHLKRNATKSPDLKKILTALRPVLNDFVGEVQRSLGYFTNTHRDAHIEYMIGLGNAFRLPGLQKFLGEKLQLDVRKLAKMERMNGDQVVAQQVYSENILTFAVAYGLALQGVKRARLSTNLLPGEIRVERLVKAKKPFAVVAAATLLLSTGALALSYSLEYRTYGNKRVTDAVGLAKAASKKASDAQASFESTKKKAKEQEEAVKTIVAGQFERDNWLQLMKFINAAVPRPDNSPREFLIPYDDGKEPEKVTIPNIPHLNNVRDYWSQARGGGMSGERAFKEYQTRLAEAPAPTEENSDNKSSEQHSELADLIQYHIESVDSFYCDNLKTFWSAVRKGDKVRESGAVRPQSDFAKYPEGAGWVIEIQGFTYHRDAETFIRNTLLENLARLGIRTPPAPADANAVNSVTPPASQAAASGGDKAPDLGPIINHISHVVLYEYASSTKGTDALIGKSVVRDLALGTANSQSAPGLGGGGMGMITGGKGGGAGNPGSGGAGAPGMGSGGSSMGNPQANKSAAPGRDSWTPLGSSGGSSGGGLKGGSGAFGGGSGAMGSRPPAGAAGGAGGTIGGSNMKGGSGSMRPPIPGGGLVQGGKSTVSSGNTDNGPSRTEFIILFIWKEPVPSDTLRADSGTPVATTGTASATPPPAVMRKRPQKEKPKAKDDGPPAAKKDTKDAKETKKK